ncbi:MAG: ATP-dependent helicase HrpB [Halioglobus sp.]|nr:ATP-dependent helicase HrpB [Halioglobus sp.]
MYSQDVSDLPVNEVLDQLRSGLREGHALVLQAPPGAGKTTLVPLALLAEPWLGERKILVLEPRRIAARTAAARMAQLLGEVPGQTVGYRIRLDSCVSERTRVEVITEGILTRKLQQDPGLEDVGLVIFDEFHERNLDSDLCLALALQGRELFRESPALKLLVMSATLDGDSVAALLGAAPVITSAGRRFPVQTFHGAAHDLRDSIVAPTLRAIVRALREQSGSILVFLPGQREITQVARELSGALQALSPQDEPIQVAPLYGGLSQQRQQQAIAPAPPGTRKVVLATNIAETSLTIEGINTVVDCGLVREAVFDTATGMTRLATRRISQASARQREGRAGRLGPGACYRLWSGEQHRRLVARATPEILQTDLAPLALQLLAWGVRDTAELAWLDPPPAAAYAQALTTLEDCGAVFRNEAGSYRLTPHGVRLAQMPLHPRLAHMLLMGCDIRAAQHASLVAALLAERNPVPERGADIAANLELLLGDSHCPPAQQGWFQRTWQQARRFARLAGDMHHPRRFAIDVAPEDVLGILLASAYPDRIARLRTAQDGHRYLLSNGRGARLPEGDALAGTPWLAVAELGAHVGESEDRIYRATALDPRVFRETLSSLVHIEDKVEWDYRQDQFVALRRSLVGRIELDTEPLQHVSEEARGAALLSVLRTRGLGVLPWSHALRQWQARVVLLRNMEAAAEPRRWPDLSDEALLATLETWLLPYLGQVRRLQDFQGLDLKAILGAQLPWPLPLELERLAPARIGVPSGSSVAVDYSQQPPVLAVKLQEMFGCDKTPTIADGRVALQLHLLSPARRPLQITQDLAGFWRNGYQAVKREMKGRYPKHPWPDDPLAAAPTRFTKSTATSV